MCTANTADVIDDGEVKAREEKLYQVVKELLETEKTYVRTLRLLAVVRLFIHLIYSSLIKI